MRKYRKIKFWMLLMGSILLVVAAPLLLMNCCGKKTQPDPNKLAPGLNALKLRDTEMKFPATRKQQHLPAEQSERAFIFIGGYGDWFRGCMKRLFDVRHELGFDDKKSLYAYYHWEGDEGNLISHNTHLICKDVQAWIDLNPKGELILLGHSYGGASSMDVARCINTENFKGKLIVVTLDPVSRREKSEPRNRAPRVDYWVNSYITNRSKTLELIPLLGGPWDECPQADVNLQFSGKELDFTCTRRYDHRFAMSLFCELEKRSAKSALQYLQETLKLKK